MKKKNIYIIGGVVVAAGVAYYIYSNKKKQKKQEELQKKQLLEQEAAEQLQAKIDDEVEKEKAKEKEELSKCMRMGELRTTENHQWVGIPYSSREQANQISAGTKIEIKNTEQGLDGDYEVLATWKDKNENVGALDVAHKLDLPKTPKGQKGEEKFSGKGLICVK